MALAAAITVSFVGLPLKLHRFPSKDVTRVTDASKPGYPGVFRRGRGWHLRRAVPKQFRSIESRSEIWLALESRTAGAAAREAKRRWNAQMRTWEHLQLGAVANPIWGYQALRARARQLGLTYLPAKAVAKLPIDDLMMRMDLAMAGSPDKGAAAAILGFGEQPDVTVSQALEVVLQYSSNPLMSLDQRRRWRGSQIGAVRSFSRIFGDLRISMIDQNILLDYREHLLDRVVAGEIKAATANKTFATLAAVLKHAGRILMFETPWTAKAFALKTEPGERRPPFSSSWIDGRLLAPGALDGLDRECRGVLLGMINTGYRLSEGANLTREQIRLDTQIPHLNIERGARRLKTRYSSRVIPLLGVSLEAFRHCPDGFPSWRDRPSLSAKLNTFLARNHLLETPRHTVTSLRHSFSDRLVDAEVDLRLRCELMGHKVPGQTYGRGASLERREQALRPLSFR